MPLCFNLIHIRVQKRRHFKFLYTYATYGENNNFNDISVIIYMESLKCKGLMLKQNSRFASRGRKNKYNS